jgi:hypothetical protein
MRRIARYYSRIEGLKQLKIFHIYDHRMNETRSRTSRDWWIYMPGKNSQKGFPERLKLGYVSIEVLVFSNLA